MIHLYAEHLLNIRTLSVQAVLSTVSNKETKARLSADGSILTIAHEGESASVKLPINLSPNQKSNVVLTIPAVPSKDLTFRVNLEEKEGVENGVLTKGAVPDLSSDVPWGANSLTPTTVICCRNCSFIVVERGKIREWKDLPSEGWAEMMDFWHCHKPDESHLHDHTQSKKGYAADSQLALEPGVGMVDTINFLFTSEDCRNVKTAESTGDSSLLSCNQCGSSLGQSEPSTRSYKLRKLQLAISTRPEDRLRTYDTEKWLCGMLLTAMDSQGVRKFVVHEPNSDEALKLWIFTPDLSVSSSARSSTDHVRVAKILWQDSDAPTEASDRMDSPALSEGELHLGSAELALLRKKLEDSSSLLPEEARTFQEQWRVGLLERFTQEDIDAQ